MLLYYFKNKDDLVAAVLMEIGAELGATLEGAFGTTPLSPANALTTLWQMAKSDAFAPHMRLFLDLSSRAGRGDAVMQDVVSQMGEGWIVWLAGLLDVSAEEQRPMANLILGAMDGQVVLFPSDLSQGDAAIALLKGFLE